METYSIMLNGIEQAKDFSSRVYNIDTDMDLTDGRYVINAKSILALFSLDLTKKLKLIIHSTDKDTVLGIKDKIKHYIL